MKNLFILLFVLTIFSSCNTELSEESKKMLAYNYAEGFVKEKLKSPSTAEFPKITEKNKHIIILSDTSYYIKSWVDSQNGFGGIVRSEFVCTIIINNDKVKVENLFVR